MLSFQVVDNSGLKVGLSMRVHCDIAGESFEVFEGGKTLRASVILHRKINHEWRINVDWAQDVLSESESESENNQTFATPELIFI